MPDLPPPLPPVEVARVETILVAGRALTPAVGSAAFGAVRLGPEALAPASGRVEDALRGIGGVQLFRAASPRTSNPTADGITARGLAGNAASRLLVTLDGVPLADPFFGFVPWGSLVGRDLASAELIRGGGLGGPGALAGTLALESAASASGGALRIGSRASVEGAGMLALAVDGGDVALFGGFSRGDGHLLVAAPGPADVPSRYRQGALGARADVAVGSTRIEARLTGYEDRRLRGVEGADIASRGTDASLKLIHAGAWATEALLFAKLADFASVTRTLDATRTTATTALDQVKTPASGWGARVGLQPPLGDDLALGFGGEWRSAQGRTTELFRYQAGLPTRQREAGGSQRVAGIFADGSWRVSEPLLLTAAARVDHWHLGAGTLREFDLATGATTLSSPSPERDGIEPSGRLGILWRPLPALRLRAAAYRGWRLPTLNELHRPFRAGQDATAANPALLPERLNGVEASFGWQHLDSIDVSTTLFANHLIDPIANVTLASGPGVFPGVGFIPAGGRYRQRQNLEAIESRGVEADARLRWGAASLTASAAYVDAHVEGGGLDGLRPAQAPELSGSAGIAYGSDSLNLSATLRYLGPRFEDDQNSRRLPAATTLDAEADVRLASRLWATLAVENLADARIATGFSADQFERGQPRTIWLGLRVSAAGS